MTQQKGQWHLIKAMRVLQDKYKFADFKLIILGCGELHKSLENLIDILDLNNCVEMVGFVNDPQTYFLNGDLFVFPSLCEGLGNVLVEAMSCGIPIISTDCPHGPRELLAPKTDCRKVSSTNEKEEFGILIPPFATEAEDFVNTEISKAEENLADVIYETLMNSEMRNKYSKKVLKDPRISQLKILSTNG